MEEERREDEMSGEELYGEGSDNDGVSDDNDGGESSEGMEEESGEAGEESVEGAEESDDEDIGEDEAEMERNMRKTEDDQLGEEALPATGDICASSIDSLDQAKSRIALLSTHIISNTTSNNFPLYLRELVGFCLSKNTAIMGLAHFSLARVFCDIRPDYIIRGDELMNESKKKLSVGVRKRVTFEQNLLSYYGKFVSLLKEEINRPSFSRVMVTGGLAKKAVAQILLKVLCMLLQKNWHFNFHNTLIELAMRFLFSRNEDFVLPMSDTLQEVIKSDLRGDVTLEIVRRVAQEVQRRKYDCSPNTLRPFLVVESTTEEINPFHIKTNTRREEVKSVHHTKNNAQNQFSRKKLKEMRIERKIDQEMKLAEAKYSTEEKKKYNMLVLDTIFRTYFRILKNSPRSRMVPMVLEGMALHTYKINYDFMLDIIALLQKLLESAADDLQAIDMVRVCYTIFNTIKLQNFLVTIDNVQFYESMYRVLAQIVTDQSDFIGDEKMGNREKLVGTLKIMLLDIKQLPVQRVASFVKRMLIVMLNCDPSLGMDLCGLITWIFKRYSTTFVGLCEQENGSGTFNYFVDQPDHSGAIDSCMWELHLLSYHSDARIRKWVESVRKQLLHK